MVPMLVAFAVNREPLVRDTRAGLERKYRVVVEQDAGDRYEYRLRLRVVKPKPPKLPKGAAPPKEKDEALKLELRLTDYRAVVSGQKVSAPFIGGGESPLQENGLPGGLSVGGPSGPIWIPLLAFYLPATDDGGYTIPKTDAGSGFSFSGKGAATRKEGKLRLDSEGTFTSAEREMGRLTMGATLDRAGWPERAEGTLVSADGTYRFTVSK